MSTDNLTFCEEDIEVAEKRVEEWGKSSTPVVLTNDEWCMLAFYLTVSNKYIKREIEIYHDILRAEEPDGEAYKEIKNSTKCLEGLLQSITDMERRISREFTQNSMKKKGF